MAPGLRYRRVTLDNALGLTLDTPGLWLVAALRFLIGSAWILALITLRWFSSPSDVRQHDDMGSGFAVVLPPNIGFVYRGFPRVLRAIPRLPDLLVTFMDTVGRT